MLSLLITVVVDAARCYSCVSLCDVVVVVVVVAVLLLLYNNVAALSSFGTAADMMMID